MITVTDIQTLFDDTVQSGHMDINKPLLYGYFFTDSDPTKLDACGQALQELGYNFVDIFKADSDDEDELVLYFLHVEKKEIHSVDSLDKRNQEFYLLADKYKLDSYDGFDMGPA